MTDLQPGSVVAMNRFTANYDSVDLQFAKLKGGRQYAFLFLGAGSPEKPLNANMCLNALGWVFDPARADEQLAERMKA